MKPAVARFYWRKLAGAKRVLDLGCGPGGLALTTPAGSEVHALDINPRLLDSRASYASAVAWDLDDEKPLPYPDAYFDAVVAKDVLEHLQKPWLVLPRVARVLKPGGIVLASVICHRGRRVWSDYTHVRGFTTTTAKQLFVDAGFDVSAIWRMGPVPGSARFGAIHLIPLLLALPPFDLIWTSSYELLARKPDRDDAAPSH